MLTDEEKKRIEHLMFSMGWVGDERTQKQPAIEGLVNEIITARENALIDDIKKLNGEVIDYNNLLHTEHMLTEKYKIELAEAKDHWQRNWELQSNAYKLLEEQNCKIINEKGKYLKIIIPDGTIIEMG